MITLPSNDFWGRRSGSLMKTKEGVCRAFKQMQFGTGSSGAGKKIVKTDKSPHLPNAWFGKSYKSKEDRKYSSVKKKSNGKHP